MDTRVINPEISLLDLMTDEGQATLKDQMATLSTETSLPLTEADSVKEKKGGFIRAIREPIVNGFKAAPALTTAFVNIYIMPTTERENSGGNFCGHDPAAPQFVMQNHAYFASQEIDDLGCKRRPQILYDIVERIKAYYDDPDVIPVLQSANAEQRKSGRKRRSEYREAAVNLLSIMIMYMDLGSFRVGQPTAEGGFFNYAIKWLAKKAKMKLSRAKRVMSDLNNAMIISSYQYRELIDEETEQYRAYNAARVFDIEFFKMLEVDEQKLGEARKIAGRKQKYINKAYKAEQSKKEQAVARLQMKKMMKMLDPDDPAFNFNHQPKVAEEIEANKRLNEQRLAVLNELMQDPYYQNNGEALSQATKARFEAEGLLMDKEKASLQ